MARQKLRERTLPDYTKGEEIFNMVSHIVGGGLGIVARVLCVIFSAIHKNVLGVVSSAIYGTSLIVLYTMSSLYHGLSSKTLSKKVFQVLDHCSIFFLIAGTYTPICLCPLRAYSPLLGWGIFGIIWGAAAVGIVLNSIDIKKYKKLSAVCYLLMGWCIVFAWNPTAAALHKNAIIFLLIGGVLYTVGALIYYFLKKKRFSHSIFHLFVLLGSISHFFTIFFYCI